MNTVKDIESAIERLDDNSLGQLSGWFEDYLAEKWESRLAKSRHILDGASHSEYGKLLS